VQHRGGICFLVDNDAGWVAKLIVAGHRDELDRYKQHVIDQTLTVLRAHPNIQCLFTTPRLLEALCEKVSLKRVGIKGVLCSGADITPKFLRYAAEELLDGIRLVPAYGNEMMGPAMHKSPSSEDNWAVIYYPQSPRAVIEVVDPDQPERVVDFGETGRVLITTLTREFFLPRFLDRDEAEREPPCISYPWDGIRNVRST
jgi:phenylacetate-coenzyme A ligase PaaK-like adenylate-forming protein